MKLTQIWKQLARDCDLLPGELRAWSLQFLQNHQRRYESDLALVKRYYQGGELLEIGAAPCHFTVCLQQHGYPLHAVDLQPDRFLPIIRKYHLPITKCDIEREPLPFQQGRFALVLLNEVFEHLRIDPVATLTEIHRVLRPGGCLLLTTPNLYALRSILSLVGGNGFDDPYEQFRKLHTLGHMGHVRVYTARQIRDFLAAAGFRELEVYYRFFKSRRRALGPLIDAAYWLLPPWRPHHVHVSTTEAHGTSEVHRDAAHVGSLS